MAESVTALEARLRGLKAAADKLADDARAVSRVEHEQALRALKAAESAKAMVPPAAARVRATMERRGPELQRLVEELAPGAASLGPDAAAWFSTEQFGRGTTRFVRVGKLEPDNSSADIPALAPLLGTSGWQVLADTPSSGHVLLQSLALRLVASAKPFQVRIDSFDPRLTGAMGLLGQITTKFPQVVPKAAHTANQLHEVLGSLVEESSSRAGRMAQLGYQTFEELVDTGATDPYRVVVLFDYPAGIDSTVQRDLVRLAATAADRGICFLVHADQGIAPSYDVNPLELVGNLARVDIAKGRVSVSDHPGVEIGLDPPFSAATTSSACDAVIQLSEGAVLPTASFMDSLPPETDWWQPARDELSTVIGYDDRTPAKLRLRTGNPALPHVLIAGAAGQGKSNLLLVLVHGLAVRYAPRDLEMYLLDFKQGVEFAPLGPGRDRPYWLPHIRVLGVHSDRAFGLAVLQHLSDELTRRSAYFKEHGNATDLSHLADDPGRPARALVVLDEFQVLLEEDDEIASESVRLIEKLMRQGRAYGIHMVLATQTIEGVSRLAMRRDSIFGQVPYRIALKSTPSDSQAVLRTGNSAAADLQFRGEAIVNANFGSPEDNQKVLVSFAERDALDGLRRHLHARARTAGPVPQPRVFHLEEPARLVETVRASEPTPGHVLEAWVGLPVAVAETPAATVVRQDPGSGVIVLGDGPLEAIGVLSGIAMSVAIGTVGQRPRFIIVDGAYADPSTAEAKASLVQVLVAMGCEVELLDQPERIADRLASLAIEVEDDQIGGPSYLLGIGMHLIPRFKVEGATGLSGADALTKIMTDGQSAGLVSFVWWNRLHVCEEHLGRRLASINAYLFLRHPRDGVRSVVGRMVSWNPEPQRALLWDGMDPEPLVVVPFAPLERGDVDALVEAARR